MYLVPMEADFICPVGHKFKSNPNNSKTPICPACYSKFINDNVPRGKQISKSIPKETEGINLSLQ